VRRLDRDRRDRHARRATAGLCALVLAVLGWLLYGWTRGFEVWTFETLRRTRVAAGELVAARVELRGSDGQRAALWHDGTPEAPAAYLVDFVYTRCPSVCRALGSEFQQMQRELALHAGGSASRVHLASISFDVAHDDVARLAHYGAQQRADARWWTIAVPATPAAARALLRSLEVVAVDDGEGGFVHNGAIHLLDAQGRLRGLYEVGAWQQALAAAQRLAAQPAQASPAKQTMQAAPDLPAVTAATATTVTTGSAAAAGGA